MRSRELKGLDAAKRTESLSEKYRTERIKISNCLKVFRLLREDFGGKKIIMSASLDIANFRLHIH